MRERFGTLYCVAAVLLVIFLFTFGIKLINQSIKLSFLGGHVEQSSEHSDYGGLRVTTFMIYMSHVEAGGHTVFPQAGVSVQPEEGKALFWFNVGSQGTYDSRYA